ncbi:MAG TPA: hypothetical protein DDZ99_06735 [Clostridiales bacterium]|nr:hypothetical protein [Clostridiales bacterium]
MKKCIYVFACFILFALLLTSCVPMDATSYPESTVNSQQESSSFETDSNPDNSKETETSISQTSEVESEESLVNLKKYMKLHFIDVGQGDAIFIELPNKQCMLVDAGDTTSGTLVVNYIKNLGYTSIDYFVATHPHTDHIGGLPAIFNAFQVKSIYMPNASNATSAYQNMMSVISNEKLTPITVMDGIYIIKTYNLQIEFLAPNSNNYENLNNYSAVIKITFENNIFLLMGDAEELSESEITDNVQADVVKVGYHGGATASTQNFVTHVSPKYAIISVGKNNTFGHPSADVIARWENSGATVYRTDLYGTIVVTSDGLNIDVESMTNTD